MVLMPALALLSDQKHRSLTGNVVNTLIFWRKKTFKASPITIDTNVRITRQIFITNNDDIDTPRIYYSWSMCVSLMPDLNQICDLSPDMNQYGDQHPLFVNLQIIVSQEFIGLFVHCLFYWNNVIFIRNLNYSKLWLGRIAAAHIKQEFTLSSFK